MLDSTQNRLEIPTPKRRSALPSNPPKRAKWHLIYFILALFDIVAITGSLYLNHQIVEIYMESLAENEKWNRRLVEYSKIAQIASDVNAPGNNVFESHDVALEETKRNENLEVFYLALTELQNELEKDVQNTDTYRLQNELQTISYHMAAMVKESDMIFTLLRESRAKAAGKRMATMDRKYAQVNSHLVALNLNVGAIAQKHFERQVQEALFLKQFEYLFGGIVIFMVVGVTLYGNMVARKVRAAEEEKATHLTALEQNKIDLEEFAVSLENAWNQAQQYNLDLVAANQQLQSEIEQRKVIQSKNEVLLKQLEEKNKELSEVTYIASHDLQEPLRKILAFGDRLRTRLAEDDDRGHDYLDRMQKSTLRMSDLIEALLDLARVNNHPRPFQQTDLNEVVGEVVEDLEIRLKDTGGSIHLDPLPVIQADRLQMQQLFQNLISNALKFTRNGTPPKVTLRYSSNANQHQIIVEDNGIGFDEKYVLKIFKPFERLNGKWNYEGTGIGLAICEKIVRNHGGSIEARSKVNQGTSFVIIFPKEVPLQN